MLLQDHWVLQKLLDTDEGNYDLIGNNTPVFFIRDATKFPDFEQFVNPGSSAFCRSFRN